MMAVAKVLRVPLVTSIIVIVCCSLHLVGPKSVGTQHKHVCLKAHGIVRTREIYRIFTHAFFHKGPWHLAITILPMLALGSLIEKHIGTILMTLILIIFWLISTLLEVAMTTLLYHIAHELFHGCSLGMSGVVFGLLVVVSKVIKFKECGFSIVKIPCSVLPWACLVLYYLAFHHGSVFMHIGGIVAGYAYKYGVFECCLPSPERLANWEHRHPCLVHFPCFVQFAQESLPTRNPVAVNRQQFLHVVYTGSPPAAI